MRHIQRKLQLLPLHSSSMPEAILVQEIHGSSFATARQKPWAMIMFGPIHIGLTSAFCQHCESDSFVRSYHAGTVALLHEDVPERSNDIKSLMESDAAELSLSILSAPCLVTGTPLIIKELKVHPPAHVKKFLKRISPLLFMPMAPQKLSGNVLRSICPNCSAQLLDTGNQPEFSSPVLDEDGMFDLTPIASIGQL